MRSPVRTAVPRLAAAVPRLAAAVLVLCVAGALAAPAAVRATLYDVPFSTPPHTVGLPPVTGAGPAPRDTVSPTVSGNPTVAAAFGSFTNQPLVFDSYDGSTDQIRFRLDDLPLSDTYCLHAEILIEAAEVVPFNDGFSVLIDAPAVRRIDFETDGTISKWESGGLRETIGAYVLGEAITLDVTVDLVADIWTIYLDGALAWSGDFQSASSISTMRFSTPTGAVPAGIEAAIDNVVISEELCQPDSNAPCERLVFSDLTVGDTFVEGSSFTTTGVSVDVGPFFFDPGPCGGSTSSVRAQVDNGGNACRSGNEIEVNNVTLDFDFGDTVDDVVIYYGEYGGTVSLGLNGDCEVRENFIELDGTSQGGVAISVFNDTPGQGCGAIRLLGEIDELTIGGQELWIDAISYCTVCPTLARSAYEDLVPMTQYFVGDTFTSGSADYELFPFYPPGPDCVLPDPDGQAEVMIGQNACGNGNELNLNNINASVDFGAPLERLVLNYGEYGGNVNLRINGDCRNVENLNQLNATDVGGVRVIVAPFGEAGQTCGMLYAVGLIEQFGIGGQEFFIDNLRACPLETAGIADAGGPDGSSPTNRAGLMLAQNRPNPVLRATTTAIGFEIADAGRARLAVYDVTGRMVRLLVDASLPAGPHAVSWDGRTERGEQAASGVYVYRLETSAGAETRRMIVLR